ncbi:hypothetical protein HY480_01505 [Candidatus Uhrbacteria bacterium]|nr:hypothetical protein [Candidatus Uhrbacteria bacterium]
MRMVMIATVLLSVLAGVSANAAEVEGEDTHRLELVELPKGATVTLTGDAIPIREIDLGTPDGIREFIGWGNDGGGSMLLTIERFPSTRFTNIACAEYLGTSTTRCTVFHVSGQRVTSMEFDGEPTMRLVVGEEEYLFVDKSTAFSFPHFTMGYLVNLRSGARSKNEFSATGFPKVAVAPGGTVYLMATHHEFENNNAFSSTVVTTADGTHGGRITGPSSVAFINDHEVRGTGYERCGAPSFESCLVQTTLDVRTGIVSTDILEYPDRVAGSAGNGH